CSGPHSPDTIFVRAIRGEFDLIVAMYHDQGHIPMKLLDFESTVNVSLGIPVIRTSVDHGTAFDIAGQNRADATNMKSAMRLAVRMALGKRARQPQGNA
ncbi:MAG: 4-hydroxythreonine-4-phosphate dehydrogenase PdxA, partial [Terracidiphilus sp.]